MNKNRDLYNRIMSSVSREVKRLLESEDDVKTDVQKAADAVCATNKTKEELKGAINFLKSASGDGNGFGNFKYKGVPLKELIPELEKRLNDKTSINERTRKTRR
jgi:hypothetical protein